MKQRPAAGAGLRGGSLRLHQTLDAACQLRCRRELAALRVPARASVPCAFFVLEMQAHVSSQRSEVQLAWEEGLCTLSSLPAGSRWLLLLVFFCFLVLSPDRGHEGWGGTSMMARSPALSVCLQCHSDFYGCWHRVGTLSSRFTCQVTPAPKKKKAKNHGDIFSVFHKNITSKQT